MIYNVQITPEMKAKAQKRADKTVANLKRMGKRQYTGIEHDNAFYYGYLGELVFLSFLRTQDVHGHFRQRDDGVADDRAEFELELPGGLVTLDVKTASQKFHIRILIPAAQFDRHDADYYVGVRLVGDTGEIHGYCTKSEMTLRPDGFTDEHAPTYFAYLSRLHEITDLWVPE